MANLVLISIILATIALPTIGGRYADGNKGLAFTVTAMLVAFVAYFLAVLLVYPRLQ